MRSRSEFKDVSRVPVSDAIEALGAARSPAELIETAARL
jgi:hypothetical protein